MESNKKNEKKQGLKKLIAPEIKDECDISLVLKENLNGFYTIAGISLLISFFFLVFLNAKADFVIGFIGTPLLYLFISYLAKKFFSRVLALILFLIVSFDCVSTFMIKYGFWNIEGGGTNIFFGILAVFMSINFIRCVFKYHSLKRSRINWKNVLFLNVIALLTCAIVLALTFIVYVIYFGIFNIPLESENPIYNSLFGILMIIAPISIWVMALNNKLPFTKNKPVLSYEK